MYTIHVKMLETKAEASEVLGAFTAIGFPGYMGSIDVVQLPFRSNEPFHGEGGISECCIRNGI